MSNLRYFRHKAMMAYLDDFDGELAPSTGVGRAAAVLLITFVLLNILIATSDIVAALTVFIGMLALLPFMLSGDFGPFAVVGFIVLRLILAALSAARAKERGLDDKASAWLCYIIVIIGAAVSFAHSWGVVKELF